MSEEDSFQVRVRNAINGNYKSCMRRPLQSVALYEADRCLKGRYDQLKPFQKKHALLSTAVDLLNTLDFLNDYHRQEIMFRTNASKEPLAPDLAWRRMKMISRDIAQTILPKAKELIENEDNSGKSHDEICALLLQSMYEDSTENTKPHPPVWEYNHNNIFTTYRIYYRGVGVDPALYPAVSPRVVEVPAKRFAKGQANKGKGVGGADDAQLIPLARMTIGPAKVDYAVEMFDVEERRAMLKEVKDHTELLKEFEGVIPEEELAARKRALYAALPPVPNATFGSSLTTGGVGKKQRKRGRPKGSVASPMTAAASVPEVTKPMAMTEDEEWEKLSADDDILGSPKETTFV